MEQPRESESVIRAPWPVSVLGIGDSWTNNAVLVDWWDCLTETWPKLTFVNEATSGKCLYDTTGTLGADTVVASIATDLNNNPDADIVVWGTSCINDLLRRAQGANAVTYANLIGAAATVLAAIKAADKQCIVFCVPFGQWSIYFGAGVLANFQAAEAIRVQFNDGLQTLCRLYGFTYYDPKWMYVNKGVEEVTDNGFIGIYTADGLHPSVDGAWIIAGDIASRLRALPWRKAAA
jgi:lysophospholipase L1-like esterase